MKLAAIYNVWDGAELLKGSINCIKDNVDLIIIVFQKYSNYGEFYDPIWGVLDSCEGLNVHFYLYDPEISKGAKYNETRKRNIGLDIARQYNCTHFLHLDCDEYYEDFAKTKAEYFNSGADGSYCKIYSYFRYPTLRGENFDNYFVPFIHKLDKNTRAGGANYPAYVDPTRKINCLNSTEMNLPMHHFSYVRKDIERKIRNSTARENIMKSDAYQQYIAGPKAGDFINVYNQKLIKVENIFNIEI